MISTNPWINLWNRHKDDPDAVQEFADFLEAERPKVHGICIAPSNIYLLKCKLDHLYKDRN